MDKQEKLKKLKENLSKLERVAVAFSAGVDSSFLLKVAHDVLGQNVVALTAKSNVVPEKEYYSAVDFCRAEGIRLITVDYDPLSNEEFVSNPQNRCYICKKALFSNMLATALENGFRIVLDGTNLDDESDYRPGMDALKELNIISPLREAQLTKAEIRALSRELDIPFWNKPSMPCLATRFPYGETITKEKLSMVESAENYLTAAGLTQVRVRVHGTVARIETDIDNFPFFAERRNAEKIHDYFLSLGFTYVSLDLGGYKSGNMNKTIDD